MLPDRKTFRNIQEHPMCHMFDIHLSQVHDKPRVIELLFLLIKAQRSSRIPTECFSWFRDEYRSIKSFSFFYGVEFQYLLYLSIYMYWCLFRSKSCDKQTRRMHIFEQSDQAVEVTLHKTQYSLFTDTSV